MTRLLIAGYQFVLLLGNQITLGPHVLSIVPQELPQLLCTFLLLAKLFLNLFFVACKVLDLLEVIVSKN
jgi:hypothetical protein